MLSFYHWLMPAVCVLCRQPSDRQQDLCQACLIELPILTQTCPRCANILRCHACLTNPPPFDRTFALWTYEPPIVQFISQLKFNQNLIYARLLGELLAEAVVTRWYNGQSLPDALIPMPLHPNRLKERGYNQALELARPLAKLAQIPLDFISCIRIKSTLPQSIIAAEQRKNNVKEAFRVTRPLTGLHLAVIDDVITTGYTMASLCHTLKMAGAAQIDVICCAKTQKTP